MSQLSTAKAALPVRARDSMPRRLIAAASIAVLTFLSAAAYAQSNPAAYTTGYRYDAGSRLVGTILPDPDGSGPLKYLAKRLTYNTQGLVAKEESGELVTWVDQNTLPQNWPGYSVFQTKLYTYDNEGRKLTESVLDNSLTPVALTQYSYDNVGRLDCTAVRMNPAAFSALPTDTCTLGVEGNYGPDRITKNTYDTTTHILKIQRALGTQQQQDYATYTYTPNGKPLTALDANQNLTQYTYDGHDRLQYWYFPSKTSTNTASTTDYEQYDYDANGNRTSWRRRDGHTITYGFDALNRVTSEIYPTGTLSQNVFYRYDLRNLVTELKFGTGTAAPAVNTGTGLSYTYDGFGALTQASTNQSGAARALSYQYDAEGHRTRVTHPDGAYFDYAYDGLNRLSTIKENGSTVLVSTQYDNQGRRKTLSRGATVTSTSYDYDGISRLKTLTQDLVGTRFDEIRGFTYSPASQVLTRSLSNAAYAYAETPAVKTNYQVNGLNQYTQVGADSPSHDANGNMTFDGSSTYIYDVLNRLTSATGAKTVNISYDPKGRLFQTSGGASGTTQFLYDGDALVAEYNGSGTLLRRYVHGSGVDEALVWYEGATVGAGTRRYQHEDHQGSITAIADSAGNGIALNTYDPYGVPGSKNTSRFQYTGQIMLGDLGMYYYKARIYNPKLGRFMQTDPIGYKDDLDLYSYVGNDPLDKTDPTGTAGERERAPAEEGTYMGPINQLQAIRYIRMIRNLDRNFSGETISANGANRYTSEDVIGLKETYENLLRRQNSDKCSTSWEEYSKSGLSNGGATEGETLLFRRGASDTKALLQRDAQAAENALGIHGVSVSTNPAAKAGQVVRCATCSSVEAAGFKVQKTGGNLNHYTVELPKPITPDVVRTWNELFK